MKTNEKKEVVPVITEEQALAELEKGKSRAQVIIENALLLEEFIKQNEDEAEKIIEKGKKLTEKFKVFLSLVKDFAKKRYDKIPVKSLVAIVSALLYFVIGKDLIPDYIPGVGKIDDALILSVCFKLVKKDVEDYLEWKQTEK